MTNSFIPLRYLTEEDLDQIVETAFRILEEIGISLRYPRAVEMLHAKGCRVEKERVFIPHSAAKWGLEHVAPYTSFRRTNGTAAFTLGDGIVRFHNTGGMPFIYDLENGHRRSATIQDIVEVTRLFDAVEAVDIVLPSFGPQDVPEELITLAATDAVLRNTEKPVICTGIDKPEHVSYVVEMAAACCGGMDNFLQHPTVPIPVSPISPLTFSDEGVETLIEIVERGAPLMLLPCPALGSTAPITLPGALAQQHAELMASFLLAACVRPGTQVTYNSRICGTDLRTGGSFWGGPEIGISGSCGVQIGHRLGLPANVYGLATSSPSLDAEYAYQRMANALLPAMAGADVISGVGSCDNVLTGDLRIPVLDAEIVSLIRYISNGIQVNTEALALDLMKQTIPQEGFFLASSHTVKHMREGTVWISPSLQQRSGTSIGLMEWADTRVREILASHVPKPLPDEVTQHLDEIMAKAQRDLVGE